MTGRSNPHSSSCRILGAIGLALAGSLGGMTLHCSARSIGGKLAPPAADADNTRCNVPEDCVIQWQQLDCCGSAQAIGVSKRNKPRDPEARLSCECLAAPTLLDDGQTAADPADIQLDCVAHSCRTALRTQALAPIAERGAASGTGDPTPAVSSAPSTEAPLAPTTEPPPVECKSTYDCWVSSESPPRPIARPKGITHRFRGCVDGEVPPVCKAGVCTLGFRYGC